MFRFLLLAGALSSPAIAAEGIDVSETAEPGYPTVWTFADNVQTPECVYYSPAEKEVFVSNVAGQPDQKDGQGWIQRLGADGKLLNAEWVTGLNAPKGMRAYRGALWVSDIDEIVQIEIGAANVPGKVISKIAVPGAMFLNDVAIDNSGVVYVADTAASKIYQVKGGKVSVFIEGANLESPNGLLVQGSKLIVASWGAEMAEDWSTKTPGHLYSIDLKTKKIALITPQPLGNLDGLEVDDKGNYLVSDWAAGKVFKVTPAGNAKLLFYGFKGSADIGYIPGENNLIVPRMGENLINAFNLTHYPNY